MRARFTFSGQVPISAVLFLTACNQVGPDSHPMPGADAGRGREIVRATGCASCHVIPGIRWPKGRVGPSLEGFAGQALLPGGHVNSPENLTGFVRDAPAFAPDGGMPPMPLSDAEARDVAAFLYTLEPR
jgi:mono/diheme cytochrome c family protein